MESWFKNQWISKFGIPKDRVTSYRQSRQLRTHMGGLKSPIKRNDKKDVIFEGCARKPLKKMPKRLNEKQKDYLHKIFVSGIHERRKARAFDVERQMRRFKQENGEYAFKSEEWLSEQKIKDFFSRTSLTARKAHAKKNDPKGKSDVKTSKRKGSPLKFKTLLFSPPKIARTETVGPSSSEASEDEHDDEELEEEAAELAAMDDYQNSSDCITAINEEMNITNLESCPIKVRVSYCHKIK